MRIDVALTPAEIALLPARDLTAVTCVVFDVLRATSSMITALAHGVTEIYPVSTIEEATSLKLRLPDALLGGERQGERIADFDLGNAPSEYLASPGRQIITTTTNGTIAVRACDGAQRVLVGALLNLETLGAILMRESPHEVLLVCAGTFAEFALEDGYAAGRLIALLRGAELTDAALAANSVAHVYSTPLEALRVAKNGRALAAKGRQAEVEWCAQVSRFNIAGYAQAGVIRPLSP